MLDWEEEGLTKQHKIAFDALMLKALERALPSCSAYLNAAKEAAKQMVKREGMIHITNPITGFPIVHKEFKTESRLINITSGFKRIQLKLLTVTDKINSTGMVSAFSPNSIHNLDASLLSMVSMQCEYDLSLIHDSIGSHPNNTKETVLNYSNSMKVLSENNVFNIMFEEMGTDVRIDTIDELGEWKGSKHCIC